MKAPLAILVSVLFMTSDINGAAYVAAARDLADRRFVDNDESASRAVVPAETVGWSDVVRRVLPAVVNISVERLVKTGTTLERRRFLGSGFFIDSSGQILTNRHVVDGAFQIIATTSNRRQYEAHLIAAGKMIDLAVLKVDTDHPEQFLRFASPDSVKVGDPVIVIGNPLGLGTSVSSGIVSALGRNLMDTPLDDFVQTDAAINHGNSGGPVVDRSGNVVGVASEFVSAGASEASSGLGFAIASGVASHAVQVLLDPQKTTVGWIGAHLQDLGPDLARAFNVEGQQGLLITQIEPDSPAQKAGLRTGDIILSYGGVVPPDSRDLMFHIALSPIGSKQVLKLMRDGKVSTVTATVARWPNLQMPISAVLSNPELAAQARSSDLGLVMSPITAVVQRMYGITGNTGIVVVAVDAASEAHTKGVEPGDVVERVGTSEVGTVDQVRDLVRQQQVHRNYVALLLSNKRGTRWISLYAGKTPDGSSQPEVTGSAPAATQSEPASTPEGEPKTP